MEKSEQNLPTQIITYKDMDRMLLWSLLKVERTTDEAMKVLGLKK